MKCPQCGNELPDTASFCPSCGTSRQEVKAADARPAEPSVAKSQQDAPADPTPGVAQPADAQQTDAQSVPPTSESKKPRSKNKPLVIVALIAGVAAVVVGVVLAMGVLTPAQKETSLATSSSVNDQRIASVGLDSTKLFTDDGFITVYAMTELNGEQLIDLVEDNGFNYGSTTHEDTKVSGWYVNGMQLSFVFGNNDGETTHNRDDARTLDIGAKGSYVLLGESFPYDRFNTAKEIREACANVDFIASKEPNADQFAGYFQNSHGDYYLVVAFTDRGNPKLQIIPPSALYQPNTLEGVKAAYEEVLRGYFHTSVD